MQEAGFFGGGFLAYTFRQERSFLSRYKYNTMLRFEFDGTFGEVDYKGSGTIKDIRDYILEFRYLLGWEVDVTKRNGILTPYTGFAHRYWNDDMSNTISTTGAHGYERESTYLYSPVGLSFAKALNNDWSYEAKFEYDHFWRGRQITHLADVPGYDDIANKQHTGYGLRGSVELKKKGRKFDFIIEPFWRFWSIRRSNEVTVDWAGIPNRIWVEPKNYTREAGFKFYGSF